MHDASDYGYMLPGFPYACRACGKETSYYCCDGAGNRLSFQEWAKGVDREIRRINETDETDVKANYSEMYLEGLSVAAAVDRALG